MEYIVAATDGTTHDSQRDQVVLLTRVVKLHKQSLNLLTSAQLFELLLAHASARVGGDARSGAA